jgi:hypothetical protein
MENRLTGPKACSLKRLEVSLLPSRKDLVKEKLHVFPGPFVRIPVGIVMYGRSRVCKDYLTSIAIQICRHVSGLFARHLDRWP